MCQLLIRFLYFTVLLINLSLIAEEVSFQIEYAVTQEARSIGLMHRENLAPHTGMLFIFPKPQQIKMWMKNVKFPLSIAILDKRGVIKEIYDMEVETPFLKNKPGQLSKSLVSSRYLSQFALEVNKGWFAQNNIKIGDRLWWRYPYSNAVIILNGRRN